jgi:hypothetical protein
VTVEGDIRAQLPRAAEVLAELSADQINWRPAEGSWSIAECIAHLNTLNGLYARSIQDAIAVGRSRGCTTDFPQTKLGMFEQWLVGLIEPPYRLKFKAPSKFRPKASTFTRDELLKDWTTTHERLAEAAQACHGLDLRRLKVVSPATPLFRITLLAALMITPAHDRRHLWQAQRVRDQLLQSTR